MRRLNGVSSLLRKKTFKISAQKLISVVLISMNKKFSIILIDSCSLSQSKDETSGKKKFAEESDM